MAGIARSAENAPTVPIFLGDEANNDYDLACLVRVAGILARPTNHQGRQTN